MPTKTKPADGPGLFDAVEPRRIPIRSIATGSYDETTATDADDGAVATATDPADHETETEPAAATEEDLPQATMKPSRSKKSQPQAAAKPRGRKAVTAETMAGKQRDISVSEFFAKNRHLLGFDNKRKALLTTIKEAVDNSLDACEEAGILPEIHVTIDQLSEDRFRVAIRDNGPGIVKSQIPNVFGKLLYGSKFHRLKMSRGQQGIGISAAGMYGLLTTGKSLVVTSRTSPRKTAHHFEIQIDTRKNRPDIIKDEEVEVEWKRGTEVAIELVGSYAKGRQSVDEYIEQTAIANPHAQIYYRAPTGENRDFPRGSDELPEDTKEIKPHPHGIELGVLMKLLKESSGVKLSGFLQSSFSRVSQRVSDQICKAAKLSPRAATASIASHEAEKLYQAMQSARIMAPPTDCLAPIGVRNLLAGLLKEVKAEFYSATTRSPAVYRGNPFQIEIALAYGGSLANEEMARVIRFANRVPLLYQQSACTAFKSVCGVDWKKYGISQPGNGAPVGPLVVMVHMASVWVPFTSESKEAIADYDEINKEMRLALQECGRKLGTYLRKRRKQKLEADRRNIFERYIPDVAESLATLTGNDEQQLAETLQKIAHTRTADADMELDEDGNPIDPADKKAKKVKSAADEFVADDGVVIVPENETVAADDDLFGAAPEKNGTRSKKKKKRGR